MLISITNVARETWIFFGLFVFALALSIRHGRGSGFLPTEATNELKGVAILLVVLSHIGYFLVSDHSFLVPLSNYAGVGVDLFLILSGYGLVASALKRPLTILQFYKKRLSKIYFPVAATLLLLLILDAVFLHKTYALGLTIKNFFGFFPQADLYNEINSPLWFITPLFFYYLIFPLLFWRRAPIISSLVVAVLGYYVTNQNLPNIINVTEGVAKLYQLHFLGFPLGMAISALANQPPKILENVFKKCSLLFQHTWFRYSLITFCLIGLFFYLNRSGVGSTWKKEEVISLITGSFLLLFFILKKFHIKILALFGIFSFEIYLLHWPILYRYDIVYPYLPAGIATAIFLTIFLGFGYLHQRYVRRFY
jgi:peptidoglycan/LPS O-acetylase OafA/YrhL